MSLTLDFLLGFKSVRSIDSPAIALGCSFLAIGETDSARYYALVLKSMYPCCIQFLPPEADFFTIRMFFLQKTTHF